MYGEPSRLNIIKAQRMRWIRHAKRLPRDRTAKITLNASVLDDKRKGRPRKRFRFGFLMLPY